MPIVVLAIVILAVGALMIAVAAVRRADSAKTGTLNKRTHKLDRQARRVKGASQPLTGKEVERQALESRLKKYQKDESALAAEDALETAVYIEPDADAVGVTRRQFLNRSVVGLMGFGLTGFGGSMLAFLWPSFSSGFGAKINLGAVSDIQQQIRDNSGFLYVPEGRMWVTEYPKDSIEKARVTYSSSELEGMEAGLLALYQKCPHLGCRVPNCLSSQWFECPCHGSQYNRVGEKRGGPAPRGLDRFAMSVNNRNEFIVDTGTIIQGPPIGINTTGQEAEGPNCISISEE